MFWEWILSLVTAIGSIAGSVYAIKAIVRHEQKACDARLDAFREGLDRHEEDK